MHERFLESVLMLFVLLNPFLLSVYLLDLFAAMDARTFRSILLRGALVACAAFVAFAVTGDAFFSNVLHVRFASFLLFGGAVFLIVGLKFVLQGPDAIRSLRGSPEHVAGSIAMPFMVGPATVSASVMAGAKMPLPSAVLSIVLAVLGTVLTVLALRWLHSVFSERNAMLVDRYVDVVGRVSALIIGTLSVEMLLSGIDLWLARGAEGLVPRYP